MRDVPACLLEDALKYTPDCFVFFQELFDYTVHTGRVHIVQRADLSGVNATANVQCWRFRGKHDAGMFFIKDGNNS